MENTNEIELRSKTIAEEYERNNREFLAKYDTDDKQIDYYTGLAMELFTEFEIDGTFTEAGVRKNVAEWFANKQAQMERFRKHPYWSEEAKAIVFLQTEKREINYERAADVLGDLESFVAYSEHKIDSDYWVVYVLRMTLNHIAENFPDTADGTITDEFIDYFRSRAKGQVVIPEQISKALRKGKKITRFARKCFENVVLQNGDILNATNMVNGDDSFDKYYAKFADYLSELQIQRITAVSVNFLDFMTMSNGNSWASCHFINSHNIFHDDGAESYSGAYKQGCLSYALDGPSFILYTLPTTFKYTDYYRCPKITRMCCQYDRGILITGKCYPNNEDGLITRYRQMMQLIISQVEGFPNLWTFSRKVSKIACFTDTAHNSAHYRDYNYDKQKPTISICKNASFDVLDTAITIGHHAYCLDCGEMLDGGDSSWLQCCRHKQKRTCAYCGMVLGEDDKYHEIDGEYYCEDHVFYCDYHKCIEGMNHKYGEVDTRDGVKLVCKYAKRYELVQCKDCGYYYEAGDIEEGYCPNCLEKHPQCSFCGRRIRGEMHETENGGVVCADCHCLMNDRIKITTKDRYEVGDYVLMCNDVSVCEYTSNSDMERYYPMRIVKILHYSSWNGYSISNLDGTDWSWSGNCFVGVVENANDNMIGMTIAEVAEYFASKEEH